jgi:predicted O-methyltransferase YrrM
MFRSGPARKLSRMVSERDEWLLQREARIFSLENEIARREATIRDREERIALLEDQVRRLETPRLPPRTHDLRLRLKDVLARLPGWCPEAKARWMVERILGYDYKIATEIGVFAGRSVFPIALAIAANNGLAVYAVDAWENAIASASSSEYHDHVWWDDVDLVSIKSSFLKEIISQNLVGLVKLLELPSGLAYAAASQKTGRTIDFLHIDGAHSEEQAVSDAANWSQLVTRGGTIVLDDIDWPGVVKAYQFLGEKFDKVHELRGEKFAFAAFNVP